ncbi:putative Lin-54 family, tesmin/TSO1-like CXC domain-containing protein [Plasmopara halstedii]
MSLSGRQRGCNCKKSNCQKLYCECFAGGGRCIERCQCLGCKNQGHDYDETVQTIRITKKRKQTKSCPNFRVSEPETEMELRNHTSTTILASSIEPQATNNMASNISKPVFVSEADISNDNECQVSAPPERTKGCNCKKSSCLKLYCECLAAQRMCDHLCYCEECKNRADNLSERERAIATIIERNPLAFHPKVANGSQHRRGCNCRKSGCIKNYCECYQAGVTCTSRCACYQCRNTRETFESAKKMLEFAGVHIDTSDLRVTALPSQRKLAKRTIQKSAKNNNLFNRELTPTNASTQRPAALELLSRSAPVASTKSQNCVNSTIDDVHLRTPFKRSFDQTNHFCTADEGIVTPTYSKRKYIRQSLTKLPFMERVQDIVTSSFSSRSVKDTNAYDEEKSDNSEVSGIQRSFPQNEAVVNSLQEDKAIKTDQLSVTQNSEAHDNQHSPDFKEDREALSPTAANLFCEESYDEASAAESIELASASRYIETNPTTCENHDDHVDRDIKSQTESNGVQERAVLHEYYVWLRNMVQKNFYLKQ